MTTFEAAYYMNKHPDSGVLQGWFVQVRPQGMGWTDWDNMSLTWPTIEEAESQRKMLARDGWDTRLCRCLHEPLP